VNTYIENESLPIEFGLLEYEPAPWTPVDTILMSKQISWTLTGGFRTLRLARIREKFGADAVNELYPARLDHNSPIIRDGNGRLTRKSARRSDFAGEMDAVGADLVDWLSQFESPPGIGSNSWVVSGEYTGSKPIVANDPTSP
jgi:penicillin amidase